MGKCHAYKGKQGTTYYYVIDVGRDPETHVRKQKKVRHDPKTGLPFRTLKRCREARDDDLVARRKPDYVAPSQELVSDYLERWLDATSASHATSTTCVYRTVVNRYKGLIGHHRLSELTPVHIQTATKALQTSGYRTSTVAHSLTVLSIALRQAVRWRLLASNPAEGVSASRKRDEPASRVVWTAAEAGAFLLSTKDSTDHPLWRLLLDSTMRIGEALALTWGDVDLEAALIRINRTITQNEKGSAIIGVQPKTRSSKRTVAISEETVAALRKHQEAQRLRRNARASAWHECELVFDRGDGQFCHTNAINARLTAACQAAKVPRLTAHGLRHTGTTLAVANGVPLRVMADRLGHASTALVDRLYTHPTTAGDRSASETISRLLQRSEEVL